MTDVDGMTNPSIGMIPVYGTPRSVGCVVIRLLGRVHDICPRLTIDGLTETPNDRNCRVPQTYEYTTITEYVAHEV